MQSIYFYGAVSLDGYLATTTDDLQWLFDTDLAGQETYSTFETKFDTLIMGRMTYEKTLALLENQPFYPGKQKIVFSHTRTGSFAEGRFVDTDPVQTVRQLQQQPGKGIWIVGGGQLVTTLLAARLITELWVQVAPVLLGNGKRLFPAGNFAQQLELVDTTRLGQLVELHYRQTSPKR